MPPTARHLLPVEVCGATGLPTPDLDRPFRLALIGCRDLDAASAVAAAHPHAQVWAWDPHPEHIESLRLRRDAMGLANLVVHERRALPGELDGLVDILAIDDALDTATDTQRSDIWRFVGESLRPGGLLSVSYRTVIGWIEVLPLIGLMRYVARGYRGSPESRAPHVLDLVRRLRDGGAAYITKRPHVAEWVETLLASDPLHVDREYLRHDLRPLSHAQVTALAEAVGCSYIGVAHALVHEVSAELVATVSAAPTVTLHQTYADLAVRRDHRTDVFRLGVI